ncbi:hypothetical protein TRSC58_07429 [Trypanosoma rangeli SC58]|uniref:Uncharacterized protein n=1 Tax=Trypanosoma rangeli SC58 TaxID=429131 RepID=A0A061IRM1_TRYRA|nr:hypothetical protein TRSC58_07429 [Trypanosoma rangeli SC58]
MCVAFPSKKKQKKKAPMSVKLVMNLFFFRFVKVACFFSFCFFLSVCVWCNTCAVFPFLLTPVVRRWTGPCSESSCGCRPGTCTRWWYGREQSLTAVHPPPTQQPSGSNKKKKKNECMSEDECRT